MANKNPLVYCVMLANGRAEMVKQAVHRYVMQSYERKRLLIYDTSVKLGQFEHYNLAGITVLRANFTGAPLETTIGELRNLANAWLLAHTDAELIAHWDSDDWSAAHRIEHQAMLLEYAKSIEVTGYHTMPFWDERRGEAWMYTNRNSSWALGTSLMYSLRVWDANHFPHVPHGEDTQWLMGRKVCSIPAVNDLASGLAPRMVARIHDGNTSPAYDPAIMAACEAQGGEWRRTPHLDEQLRGLFA